MSLGGVEVHVAALFRACCLATGELPMQIVSNRTEDVTTGHLHEEILFRARSGRYYLIKEDLETGDVDMREMSKKEASEFQAIIEAA